MRGTSTWPSCQCGEGQAHLYKLRLVRFLKLRTGTGFRASQDMEVLPAGSCPSWPGGADRATSRNIAKLPLSEAGWSVRFKPRIFWPLLPATPSLLETIPSSRACSVPEIRQKLIWTAVEFDPPPASLSGCFAVSLEVARSALLARRAQACLRHFSRPHGVNTHSPC
jgi:hypothetical protein